MPCTILEEKLVFFLINYEVICACAQSLQMCSTLCDSVDCSPPGSSVHGDSPGKNTGVSCHAFLQGIFPTQGLNPGLLHCRQIDSLPAELPGKPKLLLAHKKFKFAFWNFKGSFFLNIFALWLVDCTDAEPVDTEGQLYVHRNT